MQARNLIAAGLVVGTVLYAGRQIRVAVDTAGNLLDCQVLLADGREAPCDRVQRRYATARFLGRETVTGKAVEAVTWGSPGFDSYLDGANAACRDGVWMGAAYGAVNGGIGGAVFGAPLLGLGAVPGMLFGAAVGSAWSGTSACLWRVIGYSATEAYRYFTR